MQVAPAAPREISAHLDEAHGVIHIGQRCRGFAPMIGEKLGDNDEPGKAEKDNGMRPSPGTRRIGSIVKRYRNLARPFCVMAIAFPSMSLSHQTAGRDSRDNSVMIACDWHVINNSVIHASRATER